MNSLHLPRLGVWLARLAVVGLAACGDTVELDSTGGDLFSPANVGPAFDAGPAFDLDAQPAPPYEAVSSDAGAVSDAEVVLGYARVLVHADPDAASFVASVSASFTPPPKPCSTEPVGSCTLYTCSATPVSGLQVVLSGVRVSGSLGECSLALDNATGTYTCRASLWDFDKPREPLTVNNTPGAFPEFRADLVLPTRATLSAPSQQEPLARTATRFVWSGGTAGGVELSLRAQPDCGVMPPEPERYAVCNAPAYGGSLELPAEVFARFTDVSCLHATLRSVVSTSQPLIGLVLEVRAELDLAGDYTFAEP